MRFAATLTLIVILAVARSSPRRSPLRRNRSGRSTGIGFLSQGQPPKAFLDALQQGLRERGYAEASGVQTEPSRVNLAAAGVDDAPGGGGLDVERSGGGAPGCSLKDKCVIVSKHYRAPLVHDHMGILAVGRCR
jgi:hypothetical protein